MGEDVFPDVYGDSAMVSVGNHGIAVTFFLSDPLAEDTRGKAVLRVRMSRELASAVSDLLTRQLEASDAEMAAMRDRKVAEE